MGIRNIVPSGLGSENSHNGPHTPAQYSPELVTNGGDFMNGISAFDGPVNGIGYSMF
jgi:hypothetical protein